MRLKPWNWQQEGWGDFTYSVEQLDVLTGAYREKLAMLIGMLVAIDPKSREDVRVEEWAAEAVSTSFIEGEALNLEEVRSSVRRHLGLGGTEVPVHDLRVIGVSQMLALSRQYINNPLTKEDLWDWQNALLSYRSDLSVVGKWRVHPEPMQVLSGPMGRERIHFEAPPSGEVAGMMDEFLDWFNKTAPADGAKSMHPIVRAGIAHLWIESIHPFEDGNGRVGRAVAEKALAQDIGEPLPFSLSIILESRRREYYAALEAAQRGNEITSWLAFFSSIVQQALEEAETRVKFVIGKARYLARYGSALNDRQSKAILRMFDAGPGGFEGGMNIRKYLGITKTSKATATRDLQELVRMGAMVAKGQGRGTRYELAGVGG